MHDPVFQGLIKLQRGEAGNGSMDDFCVQCHSVLGVRSGDVTPNFDFGDLQPLSMEGVTCEVCHQVDHVMRPFNAGLVIAEDGPIRGPLVAEHPPHATQQSDIFESSLLCGTCHDVRSPSGVVLESPYQEWLKSPAAEAGRTCQDCHMESYAGQAAPKLNSPMRRDLHRHYFSTVGNSGTAEQVAGAGSVLGSAKLTLHVAWKDDGDALRVSVDVQSLVEGHNFPTGSSFMRQAWLAVEVTDRKGTVLFRSGKLDPFMDLYDRHHPSAAREDPQLVLLSSYLIDKDGQVTLLPLDAQRVESNSLAPAERRTVAYEVPVPEHSSGPFRTRVRLRFRSLPPRLLRLIGKDQVANEIVDIDEKTTVLADP